MKTGDDRGRILLDWHPLKDCVHTRRRPKENNPDRPALTSGQYGKFLEAAPAVDWRFEVALILAHETGHRMGSIRRLRWSDFEGCK